MTDESGHWNYRVMRLTLDDGYIYGMVEAYYSPGGLLQAWSQEPYWTEQDANDFVVTIYRYEARFKTDLSMPEWAFGIGEDEFPTVLTMLRRGASEPVVDERKILEGWGE